MVVTYGLIGTLPPSARRIPPTMASSAKTTESTTVRAGLEVRFMAAAAGVIRSASTSSAPTICTDIATEIPSTTMNTIANERIGSPLAWATSGSVLANVSGRHTTSSVASTTTDSTIIDVNCREDTETIWPVSKENLLEDLPS